MTKPKARAFDRLLNDPVAMFGALGGLGAVVVTVWLVAGSPAVKEDDGAAGAFQAAPTKSAAAKPGLLAKVASSLSISKLKDPKANAAAVEASKDAPGSVSASNDGTIRGTIADVEAAQKRDAAKAEEVQKADSAAPRKAVPTEVAGAGHVPGAVPDSTRLAGASQGGFGAPANLQNDSFAGGVGTSPGALSGPMGSSAGPAHPELGESGPLLASASGAPGKVAPVGSGRAFLRGQSGAGGASGPAGTGAARRAAGGLGAAGAAGGGAGPGAGTDFGAPEWTTVGSARSGTSSGGSAAASAEGADRMASVGGGAPKAAGAGGGASLGLRGGLGADAQASASGGSKAPALASKKELNDQAKSHFEQAQAYRSGVVEPLVERERRHGTALANKLQQASVILRSLDQQLAGDQAFFRGYPAALGPLANARALIGGGKDALKARLDSSRADLIEGDARLEWVPKDCNFKPIVHDSVWNRWNGDGEDWQWRRSHTGQPLQQVNGEVGYYEDVPREVDINSVATSGQDLFEGAARRATNVRQEAQAGITMVDPEFGPAVETVTAANRAAGARLNSTAGRIKDDLARVAALLPERVSETVSSAQAQQGRLQESARAGHLKVRELAEKVGERRLGYPDGPARDALDRNMADAVRASGESLAAVNSLQGTSADSMFVLTDASRGATSALQSLCYSRDRLTELAGKAKN